MWLFFYSHIKVQFCPADLQNVSACLYCKFAHFHLMGFCLLIFNLNLNVTINSLLLLFDWIYCMFEWWFYRKAVKLTAKMLMASTVLVAHRNTFPHTRERFCITLVHTLYLSLPRQPSLIPAVCCVWARSDSAELCVCDTCGPHWAWLQWRVLLPVGGQRLESGVMPSEAIKALSPAARESMSLTLHSQLLLISLGGTEILLGLTHTQTHLQQTV